MRRAAVIVIGSNSTRMLTADIAPGLPNPVRGRVETQLFLGLDGQRLLSQEAMARTAQSVAALQQQAQAAQAEGVFLLATSAARDAANSEELAARIRACCQLEMWVLSGKQEALYSYLGAVSALADIDLAGVIDIGGGSAEVVLGEGTAITFSRSLQLGAARLQQTHPINQPQDVAPALAAAAQAVRGQLPQEEKGRAFLLVGGTGAALKDIALGLSAGSQGPEAYTFTRGQAMEQLQHMAALTPQQRREVRGLPPGREHIYPTGLAALIALMDELDIRKAQVTLRNNTDGFLYHLALQEQHPAGPVLLQQRANNKAGGTYDHSADGI